MPSKIILGQPSQKKVIVISHERSGTHFLMNTLEHNFGYISIPWINFDYDLGINFHSDEDVKAFFKRLHDKPVLNIMKSHHPLPFFKSILDYLPEQFHVFYLYRDPRDLMTSYWRFLNKLKWDEGPKEKTIGKFIRASPRAGMLRYQKEQAENMLCRWQNHVIPWKEYADSSPFKKTILVRYEDLNLDFNNTVENIGRHIGQDVKKPFRPNRIDNVLLPSKEISDHRKHFTDEDHVFVDKTIGKAMKLLGYS